ncbi:hypothetical protein [Nostoc sp. DSM 114159]
MKHPDELVKSFLKPTKRSPIPSNLDDREVIDKCRYLPISYE